MEVEILITADIVDYEYESIEQMKNEVKESIGNAMNEFKGSKYRTSPYNNNGVYDTLKNVDHEVAFCDEGTYEFNRNGNQD